MTSQRKRVISEHSTKQRFHICGSEQINRAQRRSQKPRLVAVRTGIAIFTDLFLGTLAGQGLLYAALLTGLQVIRLPFYFLNNVFRLNFTFETTYRIFQRLAFLSSDFCQPMPP